ncbi:Atu4866 domain-containing protein [Pararhizobium sp.]|uniref:Atu4866 domain-containing protein n=1 Tax=Pararhizobium sp. TaxID=1977563 RepID=UPI003FA6D487
MSTPTRSSSARPRRSEAMQPLIRAALTGCACLASSMTLAEETKMQTHPYEGMWITADGHVRHNLLPGGRYDEARGRRESAYRGRYEVRGDHVEYWDDTGFAADGDFIDGVLHHGGMILYRDGAGKP